MRTEFGQRLFTARKHRGYSQMKLAKTVGMSQGTYGELELTGQGSSFTPSIARELRVNVDWLADGIGEMEMDSNNPPVKAANDGDEFSYFARSLAQLFDSLPITDHARLSGLYNLASEPLLDALGQRRGVPPNPERSGDLEKPVESSPPLKAPSK